MTKRQSIPIVFLLLWFSYTFTFYTTSGLVEFGADIVRSIKNSEFLPGWLNGLFSIVLSNIDQYLSMAIIGIAIGLIFTNYKQSLKAMYVIYFASIVPGLLLAIYGFNQMQVNRFIFFFGKIVVYIIGYFVIYYCMVFSFNIFRNSLASGKD